MIEVCCEVLFSILHLTVCSYPVTCACQSKSTLYICLNVRELLVQYRHKIGSLSDCNKTRTHKHKVFLDIQADIECGFALTCVHDMIRTYSQIHRTYKYSQPVKIPAKYCTFILINYISK